MKVLFLSFTVLLFNLFSLSAQQPLSFWSDVMINANKSQNREIAHNIFLEEFDKLIQTDSAFYYDFGRLPEISILTDADTTFKLLTWQFKHTDNHFSYYGYLLKNDGTNYTLIDQYAQLEDIEYLTLTPLEWLGGIYYDIQPFEDKFMVFSYRQNSEFEKFKSLEILSFDDKGVPLLGNTELFLYPKEGVRDLAKNRVVFKYSSDAILSLSYNVERGMVIFDHLTQLIGRIPGQGLTYVPDGTYEGFILKEGKWIYQEKIFDHMYDEAPRPMPILEGRSKDVFGKNNKKN